MMGNGSQPIFSLSHQAIGYKANPVLSDITLEINQGETVAVIGASGSGKSTLLNALYHQQSRIAALCPQKSMLVDSLSVYHNIYMGQLQNHHFIYNLANLVRPFARHRDDIGLLVELLGLSGQLFKSIDKLSGGQQQRTAIGRALYQQKAVFIGDEPLSSLDQVQGTALLHLIKARHQTVVIALHDKEMALNRFDRVIAIEDGRIAFDCDANTITCEQIDAIYHRN